MTRISFPVFPPVRKLVRSPLVWILVAATAVRLVYFLEVHRDPVFAVPIWDAAVFDDMARRLAAGLESGYPKAFFFGPLYPYFLGLVYALTGASAGAAVIIQHVIGVLICGLTYRLGREWFGTGTGLLAAGIIAVSGLHIFFEGTLLMEILVSALLAGQAVLLTRLDAGSSRRRFLAAGALLGLAAIGRPTLLLLAPLVIIPLVRIRPLPRRAVGLCAACFLAGVALAPTVTLVRNYAVEGVLVPITSSGGYNFYLGNSGSSESLFLEDRRISTDSSWNGEDSAEMETGRQLDSSEVSRYWFARALEDIRAHPVSWIGRYLDKAQLFLNGQDVPQIESYTHSRRRSSLLSLSPVGLHPLMALAAAGMVAGLGRFRKLVLLYGITGTLVLGTAAFFVTTRYRVVAQPYLCIFAAGYCVFLWESIKRREWKSFVVLAVIGVASFLFALPSRFPINERTRAYSQYLHDGFKYEKIKDHPQALAAYAQAQAVWPEDYEGHLAEGMVHRAMGQLPLSLQALERAMLYNTLDPEVPYQLGLTLYKMNRFPAAEQALRRSLAMSPRRALTHAYLGLTLATEGRSEEARNSFLTSLDLDPFQAFTHSNFGAFLAMLGDRSGARNHLLRALELDPEFIHARRNLAFVHLDEGDTVAASMELRKILEQSPGDQQARELLESIN